MWQSLHHQRRRRCRPQRRWTVRTLQKISVRSPNNAWRGCRVKRDNTVFSSLDLAGNCSDKILSSEKNPAYWLFLLKSYIPAESWWDKQRVQLDTHLLSSAGSHRWWVLSWLCWFCLAAGGGGCHLFTWLCGLFWPGSLEWFVVFFMGKQNKKTNKGNKNQTKKPSFSKKLSSWESPASPKPPWPHTTAIFCKTSPGWMKYPE